MGKKRDKVQYSSILNALNVSVKISIESSNPQKHGLKRFFDLQTLTYFHISALNANAMYAEMD